MEEELAKTWKQAEMSVGGTRVKYTEEVPMEECMVKASMEECVVEESMVE